MIKLPNKLKNITINIDLIAIISTVIKIVKKIKVKKQKERFKNE
jgi:hypothetical protein